MTKLSSLFQTVLLSLTLACLLLLCPALDAMHTTQEVSQALITAAHECDLDNYFQVADNAVRLAINNPEAIPELLTAIEQGHPRPLYFGHVASIGYDLITGHPILAAVNTARALTSVLALSQRPSPSAPFYRARRFLNSSSLLLRDITLGRNLLNRQWLAAPATYAGSWISRFPYDYENTFVNLRELLRRSLLNQQQSAIKATLRPKLLFNNNTPPCAPAA